MNHDCEVEYLVLDRTGQILVMESKGGYPYIETGVVDRGTHGGAGGGRVGMGGNRDPRIGRGYSRGNGCGDR